MHEKPLLWPFVKKTLGLVTDPHSFPVRREEIQLPLPKKNAAWMERLAIFLHAEQMREDEDERLLHAYGKSYPDLFRARQGIIENPPDLVVFPRSHEEVVKIIESAHEMGVVVIPFGGGTNIVGAVGGPQRDDRLVVSLDLREMNRLLSIDPFSLSATIEAGALGPKLEADLEVHGYALGHYPDSFQYSTLGGWIATRSAGMQSDAYGRIEDMVVSLRVVTPRGEVLTKHVPASSAGPDINAVFIGSEGTLGVITEATMRIHRLPEVKDYRGFLFKSFDDGVRAIHACYQADEIPSMFRLQDAAETELAFHMKKPSQGFTKWLHQGIKAYLKRSGYHQPAMVIVGFEGSAEQVTAARRRVFAILEKWGSFSLGKGVGQKWSKDKFNIPYLRDYIMDFSCFADVAETSATWQNLLPLYHQTVGAMRKRFAEEQNGKGYIGCHLSHSYKTGACLYFTYSGIQDKGRELEQYYEYKKLITETFLQNHGTLSHHHAVGAEHLPWLREEVGETGMQIYQGLKQTLDPKAIMNPGKIVPIGAHTYLESERSKKVSQLG